MCESVQNNHDGTPEQPGTKRFQAGSGGKASMQSNCEAKSEEEVVEWFFHYYQRHEQQTSCHCVERIDDLGGVKDGRALKQKLSAAEFLAIARQLKEARLVREARSAQKEPSVGNMGRFRAAAAEGQSRPTGNQTLPNLVLVQRVDSSRMRGHGREGGNGWFLQWCRRTTTG